MSPGNTKHTTNKMFSYVSYSYTQQERPRAGQNTSEIYLNTLFYI